METVLGGGAALVHPSLLCTLAWSCGAPFALACCNLPVVAEQRGVPHQVLDKTLQGICSRRLPVLIPTLYALGFWCGLHSAGTTSAVQGESAAAHTQQEVTGCPGKAVHAACCQDLSCPAAGVLQRSSAPDSTSCSDADGMRTLLGPTQYNAGHAWQARPQTGRVGD